MRPSIEALLFKGMFEMIAFIADYWWLIPISWVGCFAAGFWFGKWRGDNGVT